MNVNERWSVNLYLTEVESQTHAEARLNMPGGQGRLIGRGEARRNPADQEVSLIGEQIAAARALSDLAGQLLHTAALSIETVTHQRTQLYG